MTKCTHTAHTRLAIAQLFVGAVGVAKKGLGGGEAGVQRVLGEGIAAGQTEGKASGKEGRGWEPNFLRRGKYRQRPWPERSPANAQLNDASSQLHELPVRSASQQVEEIKRKQHQA